MPPKHLNKRLLNNLKQQQGKFVVVSSFSPLEYIKSNNRFIVDYRKDIIDFLIHVIAFK